MKQKLKNSLTIGILLLVVLQISRSCSSDTALPENNAAIKYQAIAADEVTDFFTSAPSKELFNKTTNGLDLKIDNASLSFEHIENTTIGLPIFKATTKYSKMSTEVFLVKVEDAILPFLFNRIADDKVNTIEFSGSIIISELNGDFVNGYKVENGVFVSQLVINNSDSKTSKNSITMKAPCNWDCLGNPWQNLNEVVITPNRFKSFNFGPRGLSNTGIGNVPSPRGTSGGGGSGGGSPAPRFNPSGPPAVNVFPCDDPRHGCRDFVKKEEDQIINELTGKALCLNDLLDKKGDSFVKDLLANFKGESEFDIQIVSKDKVTNRDENGVIREINGKTIHTPGSTLVTIEISTARTDEHSALEAARTILHEYVHADIFRKLNTVSSVVGERAIDFKTTYNAYGNQHGVMASLYINNMKEALKGFHKTVLSNDYNGYLKYFGEEPSDAFYEAMAWNGLKQNNIKAWVDLPADKKALIESLVKRDNLLTKTAPCPN